jgi:carbon-monoxide dehydrogenase medium subunit
LQAFEYVLAHSVGEAVKLLAEKGEMARPLAGGTDLLAQLRAGRRRVERLVDIKGVPETSKLTYHPGEGLHLGAAVPCYRVYEDKAVARSYPGLIDAVSMIGGIQIQGRASVGGNLCNAAPSADAIPSLIALGAVCTIAGPQGTRKLPVEQFCTGPGRTALSPGEFLVSLHLPPPPPRSGAFYLRFIPRNEMDIAVAGVGALVVLNGDGQSIATARIALAAVAPTPLLAEEAGTILAGKGISEETLQRASEAAMAAARPISDMRGTMAQRRHLVGVLTRRALHGAIQRAKEA